MASKPRSTAEKNVAPKDLKAASSVLLAFFNEVNAWEREVRQKDPDDGLLSARNQKSLLSKCAKIYKKFCTPQKSEYGRPNCIATTDGGSFSAEKIIRTEVPRPRQILFYTKGRHFRNRYLVIREGSRWRVHRKECFSGGWIRENL